MTISSKQKKGKLVNFRVADEMKLSFEITARLRGTTLSGLIHQLLVKAMREEKDREPKAFEGIEQPSTIDVSKTMQIPIMAEPAGANDRKKK